MFTRTRPKPTHPLGSRRLRSDLAEFINETCAAVLNDASLKLNEDQSLCTKCHEEETKCQELWMDFKKITINEQFSKIHETGEMENSPNLADVQQDYSIEKLNEVFKLFQLEPVVLYV